MNPEDYQRLQKAAALMMDVRCILEGIYESMDSADPLHAAFSMLASDATYLEDNLDYLAETTHE